jgi:hypothetical protein
MTTCPHCGYESAGLERCPLCSTPLRGADDESSARATPRASAERQPPWEDTGVPFPQNLLRTWLHSVLEPTRFFRGVPYEAPALRPLLYFLLLTVVAALFTLWWQAVGLEPVSLFEEATDELRGSSALTQFFLSPFAGLLGLLLWSLILQLFVLMIVPTRRGLGATLRVLCYSAGPTVLAVIPYIGGLVGFVWSVVLQIIGIRAAHRTTGGRAAAVVMVPLGLLFLLMVSLVALVWMTAGGLLLQDLR